jgi:hypothetical protein
MLEGSLPLKPEPQQAGALKSVRLFLWCGKEALVESSVDIFRSDAWSCCCTFIFKQAGKAVIDGVFSAWFGVLRAHLMG